MLKRQRLYWALPFVTALAVACGDGGSSTDTTGGAGGKGGQGGSTTSSGSTGGAGGMGGAGGSGPECPSNEGTILAANQLIFGEGNSGEWKSVGFDLDGLTSTAASKDVCMPNAGGSAQVAYPDGDNGIDNSFGKNLLPLILGLYPTWVKDINTGIDNGNFTALLKLMCLPPEGDVPQFTTKLFGATALGAMPKFDGTDKWPVEPGLLSDIMDPETSTILFPNSSLKANQFDAGKNGTFILSVPLKTAMSSTSIKLTLYAAKLQMTLSADHKTATPGMVGGVLNTEEFIAELKKVGALLNLCGNPLFDNLLTQVRQASDIMADGTQDPTKTCDGISTGLGFEMAAALINGVGPANPMGTVCP